jgi:Amt family ammonium transporter
MQIINNDGAKETIDKFNKLLTDGWSDKGVTGGLGTLFGAAYSDLS